MTILRVLDIVENEPCPNCGSRTWIVDGDGYGRYWLLCMGIGGKVDASCVETRAIPADWQVALDTRGKP